MHNIREVELTPLGLEVLQYFSYCKHFFLIPSWYTRPGYVTLQMGVDGPCYSVKENLVHIEQSEDYEVECIV